MKPKKQDTAQYPKFLTNKLCEQDLFEGKSHDSIAQNIANVLEKGCVKIVGLDGGWGSGKSNMVSLIKNKLNVLKHIKLSEVGAGSINGLGVG